MGLVSVTMLVQGTRGRRRKVEMLVDSGAVWSLLPETDWKALGLKPSRIEKFCLADGTVIERPVSGCEFSFEGIEAPSPVILGGPNDVALLGSVTLESLALVLNPFERSLKPMRMLLASMQTSQPASRQGAADFRC